MPKRLQKRAVKRSATRAFIDTGAIKGSRLVEQKISPTGQNTGARKGQPETLDRFREVMVIAREKGLFQGAKDTVVRGRMPEALVQSAKARTGIQTDTELLELALASLAVADDFAEWLLSRRGKLSREIDLEF